MDTTSEFAGEIAAAVDKTAPAEDTTPVQPTSAAAVDTEPAPKAQDAVVERVAPSGPGPIPFEAHDRIVSGFHKRLDAVSWANGLDREEVAEALAIRRQLAERRQRQESESRRPTPNVKDERGEHFYSVDKAMELAQIIAQDAVAEAERKWEERLGPIEGEFAQRQRTSEIVHQHDHVMALPGAKEHEAAMADYIYQINERRSAGENVRKPTAMDAYLAVVPSQLHKASNLDARLAEAKKQWLAELNNTTERVQSDVNPAKQPASARKKNGEYSFKEALSEAFAGSK